MAAIRAFRNSDTQRLAVAWQQHWFHAGLPVATTVSQLEQAILDKPFFAYEDMLVIDQGGELVGFAYLQRDTSEDPPPRARIACLCIGESPDRVALAKQLIGAVITTFQSQGVRQMEAGTILGDLSGLVGLDPFAGVIGILDQDQLVTSVLREFGFQRQTAMLAFELDLTTFRVPFDRELLMLRRTVLMEERPGRLPTDWQAACAHSHFDITNYVVLNRAGVELASATYYLSDPDAAVMDRAALYLAAFEGASANDADIDLAHEIRYSVSGSLSQMASRGFLTVRAIINTTSTSAGARVNFLEQLGFRKVASGAAYVAD